MNRVVGFLERRKFMKIKRILSIILSFTIISTTIAAIPFKSNASTKSSFVASYSGTYA